MSSKYRLEPVKVSHFYELEARQYDQEVLFSQGFSPNHFEQYVRNSYAFTGFYEDDIIGIGGITPLWNGVAEAWLFLGNNLYQHRRFVFKEVSKHLALAFDMLDLVRIQLVCLSSFEGAHVLARHLKFKEEGTLRSYNKEKDDYILFSRLCDD